jgi:hypothetical protein
MHYRALLPNVPAAHAADGHHIHLASGKKDKRLRGVQESLTSPEAGQQRFPSYATMFPLPRPPDLVHKS